MSQRTFFFALFLVPLLFGCASIGVRDSNLQLQITPQPVLRGKPALAQINAPLDAKNVTGIVVVAGSPRLIFRKDEDKGLWYFYGTIPFSPWVVPGSYTVRVLVDSPPGPIHYAETKVDLK